MVGGRILRADDMDIFRRHLLCFPHYCSLRQGHLTDNPTSHSLAEAECARAVERFAAARWPIVSTAGSKSAVPFWDYSIALNPIGSEKTVRVEEILVQAPIYENSIRALLMAYYILKGSKYGIERIDVPLGLADTADFADIPLRIEPHTNTLGLLCTR